MFSDVTDGSSIESAFQAVAEEVSVEGLSLLINNAATYDTSSLSEVTAEKMMKEYATDTVGPLMVTKVNRNLTKCLTFKMMYREQHDLPGNCMCVYISGFLTSTQKRKEGEEKKHSEHIF